MAEPLSTALPTQSRNDSFPTLLGQYRIVGMLGQGGMGTVYKGYHLRLKRYVAIKTLRTDRLRKGFASRFLREMEAIGQLDHPNIVRAFDAGERSGTLYLVMEYLAGVDLDRLLSVRVPLSPADACALTRQAALGLDYLHKVLVHRDVKPSNLMLMPAGVVKILDLGLARLDEPDARESEQTPEGYALGTYDYIAPEQALGVREIDGRADIYSLGCTLFKLLIGKAPFQGPDYPSAPAKLFAHCHKPLDTLPAFGTVPEAVGAVLLRMTAKDPAQRYPTGNAVAEALAPLAAGSRPHLLLTGVLAGSEVSVRPLPAQVPEDISRMGTEVPLDTQHPMTATSRMLASVARSVASRPARYLVAGIVAATALAWLAVALVPHIIRPDRPGDPPAVRVLDALPARHNHKLLDLRPVLSGGDWDDSLNRWDEKQQTLAVTPDNLLLAQFGTTGRPSFKLDVFVRQAPWSGGVGIFWGYQEDAGVKAARAPDAPFASFQMICLWRESTIDREERFFMRRAHVNLSHNQRGQIAHGIRFLARHDVEYPSPKREMLMRIEVAQQQLKSASFDATRLETLYNDSTNDLFMSAPATGSLGVVSLQASATFSNVWFVANP